jgi:hypothetical protein
MLREWRLYSWVGNEGKASCLGDCNRETAYKSLPKVPYSSVARERVSQPVEHRHSNPKSDRKPSNKRWTCAGRYNGVTCLPAGQELLLRLHLGPRARNKRACCRCIHDAELKDEHGKRAECAISARFVGELHRVYARRDGL